MAPWLQRVAAFFTSRPAFHKTQRLDRSVGKRTAKRKRPRMEEPPSQPALAEELPSDRSVGKRYATRSLTVRDAKGTQRGASQQPTALFKRHRLDVPGGSFPLEQPAVTIAKELDDAKMRVREVEAQLCDTTQSLEACRSMIRQIRTASDSVSPSLASAAELGRTIGLALR